MEGIIVDSTAMKEKQGLNEASISQLNEIHQSPHDGPTGYNFLKEDPIPKGHGIPKKTLTPPLEPVPAVTTSQPPSLTYAPTLPTQESDLTPLQRHDSNEATCDSNSQHSADASDTSSAESLIPSEAAFKSNVVIGMAQHLDEGFVTLKEGQQRASTFDLSLTQEEESSLKLNDGITAVLKDGPTSNLDSQNDDNDPPHLANSTPSLLDRQPPPLLREPSTDVDGASSLLEQETTSASMTDAVQDTDNYRNEFASYNLGQEMAARNARRERIVLVAVFTQLMFYGILLTLLMVQTLHPGLLQV